MAEKLKSRKWWLTFGALVVMLFGEQLGISLTWEQIVGVVSTVTGYNLGQGYVDGQKERSKAVATPGQLEDFARASALNKALESDKPTADPA